MAFFILHYELMRKVFRILLCSEGDFVVRVAKLFQSVSSSRQMSRFIEAGRPIGASPRLIGAYNCRWKFILVDYDIYIHCVYTPYLLYIVVIFFSTDGCVLSCISHFFKQLR